MACVPVFAFCDAMEITYTANVDRADTPSSHPFFLFFNCLRMFFAHDQKHTETLLETLFVFIRRTRRSVRYSCQARRQSLALSPFAARVKDSRQLYLSTAQLQCSSLERILYLRHYAQDPCSHSSRLQSTCTTGLPFTLKHSSLTSSPRRPRNPISSRCVLCLSACLLVDSVSEWP